MDFADPDKAVHLLFLDSTFSFVTFWLFRSNSQWHPASLFGKSLLSLVHALWAQISLTFKQLDKSSISS